MEYSPTSNAFLLHSVSQNNGLVALYNLTLDDPILMVGGVIDLKCTNPYAIEDSPNVANLEYELNSIADIEHLEERQRVTCSGMLPVTQVVR